MSVYATGTEVPSERSRMEIERTLQRYGAEGFAYGWQEGRAVIGFRMKDRNVRFILPMPVKGGFARTRTGVRRSESSADAAFQAEQRRRWRALALSVKAKLEMVSSGIVDFEDEFLSYIVLPDGKTVADHVRPGIEQAYAGGGPKALLPSF